MTFFERYDFSLMILIQSTRQKMYKMVNYTWGFTFSQLGLHNHYSLISLVTAFVTIVNRRKSSSRIQSAVVHFILVSLNPDHDLITNLRPFLITHSAFCASSLSPVAWHPFERTSLLIPPTLCLSLSTSPRRTSKVHMLHTSKRYTTLSLQHFKNYCGLRFPLGMLGDSSVSTFYPVLSIHPHHHLLFTFSLFLSRCTLLPSFVFSSSYLSPPFLILFQVKVPKRLIFFLLFDQNSVSFALFRLVGWFGVCVCACSGRSLLNSQSCAIQRTTVFSLPRLNLVYFGLFLNLKFVMRDEYTYTHAIANHRVLLQPFWIKNKSWKRFEPVRNIHESGGVHFHHCLLLKHNRFDLLTRDIRQSHWLQKGRRSNFNSEIKFLICQQGTQQRQ